MKKEFTLRKGIVVNRINKTHYLIKDVLHKREILVSIPVKLYLNSGGLEIGEVVYAIVSPYNLSKGRLYIDLIDDKSSIDFKPMKIALDSGQDPLLLRNDKLSVTDLESLMYKPPEIEYQVGSSAFFSNLGWKEVKPACLYENDLYELVFDTSSHIEIYSKKSRKRILEGPTKNLRDLLLKLSTM